MLAGSLEAGSSVLHAFELVVEEGDPPLRILGGGDACEEMPHQIRDVTEPITIIEAAKNHDYILKVNGGGISGQAGAARHAISRALVKLDEKNKKALKAAGFLTRDPRMVERKKSGQPKARKRFQFSKR